MATNIIKMKEKTRECGRMHSCQMCEVSETCKLDHDAHSKWLVNKRMSDIKYKIIVGSNKGGVGKSTVTVNLAFALERMGFKVGLADADLHGPNIPKMLGIESVRLRGVEDGIAPHTMPTGMKVASLGLMIEDPNEPIVWRDAVKYEFLIELLGNMSWGKLDFLVIDLPPGTGNEQITIMDFIPNMDGAVVVSTPQDVALLDARKMVSFVRERNIPILGVVENMSGLICPHCSGEINVFRKGGGSDIAGELGVPFIGNIPLDGEITMCSDKGTPIVQSQPDSIPAKAFMGVAEKCAGSLGIQRA
ncbi:MAG: Mrp/NBP35 family ATP-binding protein [Gallionellaceae bacterium]|nr:Mrp/NBP35 family ATP-binding protein [Gallionellaceae bacterium]